MTVRELIEELKVYPQDYDVMRGDMEYGPFYITTVRKSHDTPNALIIGTEDD
mgnify:CR=1 FL=1